MAYRTPRDEREWRAMVERGLRESRSGIRAAVDAAIGTIPPPSTGGGTVVDTRHPTAPIELTYQTSLYLSPQRRYEARFILDFPDVTKATDGTDITVSHYELWAKPISAPMLRLTTDAVSGLAAPGLTLPGLAATPENVALAAVEGIWTLMSTSIGSFFRTDGFDPGTLWDFRARAIGSGMATPGNWSAVVQVQMVADSTPPAQPSAPILSVDRGTITARWDGMAVTGAMPADFRYVILAHGTGTSPTQEIARFGRGGGFKVVADIPYYDPQFFRLKAVDESGNESPWSEQAVTYITPLVDADIILSTIDAAKTHLKNIDAGVSILPNSIITEHLVVTEDMTAALASFLYIKADKIDVNSLAADNVFTGLLDAKLVRSDMFEGKAFFGGTFTTDYGGKFQTDVEELVGIKLTADYLKAWSGAGAETFVLDAATGDLSIFGGTFTGSTIQTTGTALRGIKISTAGGIKAYSSSGVNTFSIDPTTGNMVATGMIQTGATGARVVVWDRADGTAAVDMYADGTGVHGSIYTQPHVPLGGQGGGAYVTNVMHYTGSPITTTNWTARLTLFQDEQWAIGQRTKAAQIAGDTNGQIFIRGKLIRNNSTDAETFVVGTTVQSADANGTYVLTYASPVPTGTRTVMATANASWYVSSATQNESASGFAWIWSTGAGSNCSMRFLATWTT